MEDIFRIHCRNYASGDYTFEQFLQIVSKTHIFIPPQKYEINPQNTSNIILDEINALKQKISSIESEKSKLQNEIKKINDQIDKKYLITWPDGKKYIGEMLNGKRHGKGSYSSSKGKYEGDFQLDNFHGKGVLTFSDGSKYEGEFKDSKFHGKGIFMDKDGNILYDGEYQNDLRYGKGKSAKIAAFGEFYEGEFKNGKYHGRGQLKTSMGSYIYDAYDGIFNFGLKHGYFKVYGYDYSEKKYYLKFEGEFRNDEEEGKGTEYSRDGKKLKEGIWKKGKYSSLATFFS